MIDDFIDDISETWMGAGGGAELACTSGVGYPPFGFFIAIIVTIFLL
jgi:hypothetical protein